MISRVHAQIHRRPLSSNSSPQTAMTSSPSNEVHEIGSLTEWVIADLKSMNGIYVNYLKVDEQRLSVGDIIGNILS
jgi:pSer/pThr/pTyr-binding forkhead associated (FHA) protein